MRIGRTRLKVSALSLGPPSQMLRVKISLGADQRQIAIPEQGIRMVEPSGRRKRKNGDRPQARFDCHAPTKAAS